MIAIVRFQIMLCATMAIVFCVCAGTAHADTRWKCITVTNGLNCVDTQGWSTWHCEQVGGQWTCRLLSGSPSTGDQSQLEYDLDHGLATVNRVAGGSLPSGGVDSRVEFDYSYQEQGTMLRSEWFNPTSGYRMTAVVVNSDTGGVITYHGTSPICVAGDVCAIPSEPVPETQQLYVWVTNSNGVDVWADREWLVTRNVESCG